MTKLRGIAEKRKNVIHAAGLYLFRLSSASDWTFHNHLCPELIGDVIVTGTSTGKIAGLWYRISHSFSMTYTPIVYRLNPDKLECQECDDCARECQWRRSHEIARNSRSG